MKDILLVRKYINNGNIEIRQDDQGCFIRLTRVARGNNEICDISVDFRVNSMYEIINEETTITSQSAMCSFYTPPKYIKLPLRFDEDGAYLKTKRKFKKMTKEEIEKELGYKIDIIN